MSSIAAPRPSTPAFSGRRMFTFICMVFGMFMAILDIQIVSASLAEIQAGLGAANDEISWVQTAYLIAEVIMIPLSGYLSRMISTRWMFVIASGGFTFASLMCATSGTINEMILWRAIQGFIGGGMIPTVFASAYTIFPREKQAMIAPIIGLVATLAPTIGPTVGGYLTELFSWHWLFLVNVVPGIFVTAAAYFLIDFDEPDLSLFDKFDWLGLASMATMLGALEYVLEEGPSKDWLQDELIFNLTIIAVVSTIIFFFRAFTREEPVVDLSAFANRNFTFGCIFSFCMGIGLYGLTYIYPLFLARIRGFSSLQIGETMFVSGIAMFATAPFAGRMMRMMDLRLMIGIGFVGVGIGTLIASRVTSDWDFWELLWPQIFRGVFLMICMVPINNIALGTMPPSRMKNASGLFNLTRNLGGAVGLALINSVMTDRSDLHYDRLREAVNYANPEAVQAVNNMTHAFSELGTNAGTAAIFQLNRMTLQQASVMSFADVFILLTILFCGLALALPLVQKPAPLGGGGGGH
ncbi:DHA2 family efflux MFS transporter permease subunit [Oryzibacter oryziterrae]|uniref:DHA2 family efflux MFS transporter permease subunit n=1 Tax=Oryzibacter oryziterrae TaxID=2766474 RepID=UPI001F02F545|nr:DHA2 family efflux MFS transporter permease subunit [Oryzibacter oryziterrae]